jgi:hypothetical protein
MRVTHYQILTENGESLTRRINELAALSHILVTEGLDAIASVRFYIIDGLEHFVILRNSNSLIPEFSTTDPEKQREHMGIVLKALDFRNLDDQFVRHIRYV